MRTCSLCLVSLACLPLVSKGASQYTPWPLSNPSGGSASFVAGASSFGAVGTSYIAEAAQTGSTYQPAVWQGLSSTLLPVPSGYQGSASAINRFGDAAGSISTIVPGNNPQPARSGEMASCKGSAHPICLTEAHMRLTTMIRLLEKSTMARHRAPSYGPLAK